MKMANMSVEKIEGLKEPFFLQKQYRSINCDMQFYQYSCAAKMCVCVSDKKI